jgi:quaternary ammonium compound-resistance protein SugE
VKYHLRGRESLRAAIIGDPGEDAHMAWLILFLGGMFEVGWLITLKYTEGFTRLLPSILTLSLMLASIGCLGIAVKTIPMGTAYAVWTGTSIAGAAVVGICFFGESTTPLRLVSIALILAGVVGLRMQPNHTGAPSAPAGETRQK